MEIIQAVVDWYMVNLNYFTVALLMAIESSFIPFPSEVVIPFAAYKAAQGGLNVFGVVIAGTIGALIGALFNYYLSLYLGRPLVYKFADSRLGRVLLLSKDKVQHAENYFIRNGNSSTFIGRLVPAVRQLISIPAGLARMDMRNFLLYTAAGAGIWNIILAVVGYFVYELRDKILPYIGHLLIVLGVAFIAYLIIRGKLNKKKNKDQNAEFGQ
ncbi:MAG TPA: DedA family protein [Bacteroidales bacterium]|jgi:membrane protein DedA with SNARE-associated domain|nr:DedA family protein [Bacteroidales bacterium]HOS72936.1 DedA family protein [Bacteroidales bacterium]HQH22924.1 DedA family protein [Bacteroidales bacterium]HQJ81985.1 DedA family protein [Bacteroidales bacterium]